jgi:hypothetical protein
MMVAADYSFCQSHSPLVDTLRSEMRYKFALDALVQRKFELRFFGERLAKKYGEDINYFMVEEPPEDTLSLEEFRYYGESFSLRRTLSMDGRKQYFVLIWNNIGPQEITLLQDDTTHAVVLDTFEINATGENTLQCQRLNNTNILKISREYFGLGQYRKEEALVGIKNDKFNILFSTKILEGYDRMLDQDSISNEFVRTMSSYKLVDLNNDGFLDIEETVTEDIIAAEKEKSYKQARVLSHVSDVKNRYFWNDNTHAFDKVR